MRKIVLICLLGALPGWSAAEPATLQALVKEVRSQKIMESRELAERERKFREARDQRAALLREANRQLAEERSLGAALKRRYEENEAAITERTARLDEKTGSLGELFGVSRQIAKEVQGLLNASLVSAQSPGRGEAVEKIAESKRHPSAAELEALWHTLLEEMMESGRIARFEAPVITPDGAEVKSEVLRVGAFNLVSDGHYLRYLPESENLVVLGKQPPQRFQDLARDVQEGGPGVYPMGLDPSRGAILSLMVQTPTVLERIQEGGVIGYIILALGAAALLLAVERLVVLGLTHLKLKRQQADAAPREDNPLGRLRSVERSHPDLDSEALGLKLDHAVLGERRKLRRFLSSMAIFASVAPLLGLLGTVSGMIETFQSITLFGTGDPKLMSSGISLALVTTELGLVVAIPILLLHGWLSGFSRRLVFVLDEESAALTAQREAQRAFAG